MILPAVVSYVWRVSGFLYEKNRNDANTRSAPLPYDKGEN